MMPIIVVDSDDFFCVYIDSYEGYDGIVEFKVASTIYMIFMMAILLVDYFGNYDDTVINMVKDLGLPEYLYTVMEYQIDEYHINIQYSDTIVALRYHQPISGYVMSKKMYCYYMAFINSITKNNNRSFDEILSEWESNVSTFEWSEVDYDFSMVIPNYGSDFQKNLIRHAAFVIQNRPETYSTLKADSLPFGRAFIP